MSKYAKTLAQGDLTTMFLIKYDSQAVNANATIIYKIILYQLIFYISILVMFAKILLRGCLISFNQDINYITFLLIVLCHLT